MTREAINELKKYTLGRKNAEKVEISVLQLNRVIKALEPCENAISRKAILEEFENDQYHLEFCKEHHIERSISMEMVRIRLHDLPSVNPQPKTGYWILTSDDDYEYCTCSECGYQNGENWMIGSQIKYCQECGAKMIEPQESENK